MDKFLAPLIGPLTDLLMWLTGVLHSYGLAIVLFTILVRGILAPLNLRQLRSAKKMAALAPRIKELQQRHKGNRDEQAKATMALYKEEGVNPAAGCLPLLIQMPVLYALFFVFQQLSHTSKVGATAIYHQVFLWFTLDKPDHLFGQFLFPHSGWGPLPLLAAGLQWMQSRMMMQPTSDPQQRTTQQIMQFMPLFILLFAVNYPAGLALYWVTSTTFSIVMQYFITGWGQLFKNPLHVPEAAPPPARPPRLSGGDNPPRPDTGGNGRGPAPRPVRPTRRPHTPSNDDGAGDRQEDESVARMGKMQRAAMRTRTAPKGTTRPRSSKGAKR